MTDVRLTATNPEDSSVVPVACNDKGELKLEEPITFDGDLDGDLTVNGSGVFQGRVKAGSAANSGQTVDYGITSYANQSSIGNAAAVFGENENSAGRNWCGCKPDGSVSSEIFSNGSATFAGDVNVNGSDLSNTALGIFTDDYATNGITVRNVTDNLHAAIRTQESSGLQTSLIRSDGSANFAKSKAGFTKEGYLWCTTERGDLVWLQGTSNGVGIWAPFTPPSRGSGDKEQVDEDFGVSPEDPLET